MAVVGDVERTNVRVMARCRPFNARELNLLHDQNLDSVVVMENDTVRVLDPERQFTEKEAFQFDHALWSVPESQVKFQSNPFVNQEGVFELTGKPAVENAMQGYHCTLFAYGQTGSGKTYTMLGSEGRDEGIAPRLVRYLFHSIEESKRLHPEERLHFTVELSFLEIYNERVKDLLAISERGHGRSNQGDTGYAECRVRFHPEKGTYVEGLTRLAIASEDECLAAIKAGMEHRATTSTLMNDTSSRSHAIFQVCLSQKSPMKGTTRVSIMNLVDLAGSERIKLSGATGQALLEARNINLSLSTLRRVIDVLIDNSKLRKGQRAAVPPYRESLLTWVLSDSLGGNSKTMMIVAVSPYAGNVEDTLSTLRYGLKAKAIVCNARVNEEKTAAVVNMLRTQMEELRKQLEAKADADQAEQQRLQEELRIKEDEFSTMQAESKRLDDMKRTFEEELRQKAEELHKAHEQIEALQNVEEERKEKEEELRVAQELQVETAKLLKAQEEERKKRDAELAAVITRKNSLQRHHDRAAEEEVRAKLAAEQARLRQFVSAFQNAFLLGKQRTGLEEMQEEHANLTERLSRLHDDLQNREQQLAAMQDDRVLLQRKVDLLEKRVESMHKDLEEVHCAKNKKLTELLERRAAAEEELRLVREEATAKRAVLNKIQMELEMEQEEANHKYNTLQQRHATVLEEHESKSTSLAQSRETLAKLQATLDSLKGSSRDYQSRIDAAKQDNERKESALHQLQQRKDELQRRRDELKATLEDKKAQLRSTQDQLVEASETAAQLRQNHQELRNYVSHKFFPTGEGPKSARKQQPVASSSSATPMRTPRPASVAPFSPTPQKGVRPLPSTATPHRSVSRGVNPSLTPNVNGTPLGRPSASAWRSTTPRGQQASKSPSR